MSGSGFAGLKGNRIMAIRRTDFFVKIMVELKSLIELNDVHLAQCRNYFEAYDLPVGLLIHSGSGSLQHKS